MNQSFSAIGAPEKVLLTVENFLLLDEAGVFADHARTELIDGEIWFVNSMLTRHGRMTAELATDLNNALRAMDTDLRPWVAPSTVIDEHSMPEPDIVISRYAGDKYVTLESVALLVEISESSLDIDLGRKLRMYARAGVPEYWVVDLNEDKVRQMWSPEGEAYRQTREVPLGDSVEAATIAGLSVPTTTG